MRPFIYEKAPDIAAAVLRGAERGADRPATMAPRQFIAGGTTLLDLMKLDVMRPEVLIDINGLDKAWSKIETSDNGLKLGGLARMSDVASDASVLRDFPVLAQSLQLAASQQIRNMATLGGNVLQRTRCTYFRDVSYENCNKRNPGSGCAAYRGVNRTHAVFGGSEACVATYPGDFAQALIALDAQVEIAGSKGRRQIAFKDLHVAPGNAPHVETTLAAGELVTAFTIQSKPRPRSLYLKVRDRESYEFALASVAIALDLTDGVISDVRIALGGLATRPWRASEAEQILAGQTYSEALAAQAAEAAMKNAVPLAGNKFKIELGKQAIRRALDQAVAMEI